MFKSYFPNAHIYYIIFHQIKPGGPEWSGQETPVSRMIQNNTPTSQTISPDQGGSHLYHSMQNGNIPPMFSNGSAVDSPSGSQTSQANTPVPPNRTHPVINNAQIVSTNKVRVFKLFFKILLVLRILTNLF